MDTEIFWVVVLSLVFWIGIWKHELLMDWIRRASDAMSAAH